MTDPTLSPLERFRGFNLAALHVGLMVLMAVLLYGVFVLWTGLSAIPLGYKLAQVAISGAALLVNGQAALRLVKALVQQTSLPALDLIAITVALLAMLSAAAVFESAQ